MKTRFTIAQLQELQAAGTIKGFSDDFQQKGKKTLSANQPQERLSQKTNIKKVKLPQSDAGRANKLSIYDQLQAWSDENGFLLIREHTFSSERDWRLDWAVFDGRRKVVAVEYEGIFSKKSRHTTHAGFTADSDKYRAAALEGWKVLRYTAKNYKNIVHDLKKLV